MKREVSFTIQHLRAIRLFQTLFENRLTYEDYWTQIINLRKVLWDLQDMELIRRTTPPESGYATYQWLSDRPFEEFFDKWLEDTRPANSESRVEK